MTSNLLQSTNQRTPRLDWFSTKPEKQNSWSMRTTALTEYLWAVLKIDQAAMAIQTLRRFEYHYYTQYKVLKIFICYFIKSCANIKEWCASSTFRSLFSICVMCKYYEIQPWNYCSYKDKVKTLKPQKLIGRLRVLFLKPIWGLAK